MWGISWYGDALRTGVDPAIYPLAFYPGGWQLATFGQSVGPALFLAMLPLHWIAGAAFAYQIAVLLTFALAFGGTLALAGRFVDRLGATVAALLYTFWGFRWYQTAGHLNFLLGSACLPWMIWALECFLQRSSASIRVRPRPILWLFLVGIAWAAAIAGSMYFIWIGGILLAGWLFGRRLGKQIDWRMAVIGFVIPAAVALLLSLPALLAYWQRQHRHRRRLAWFDGSELLGRQPQQPAAALHLPSAVWVRSPRRSIAASPTSRRRRIWGWWQWLRLSAAGGRHARPRTVDAGCRCSSSRRSR